MIEDEKGEISYIEGMRNRGAEFEGKVTVISLTHPFIECLKLKGATVEAQVGGYMK